MPLILRVSKGALGWLGRVFGKEWKMILIAALVALCGTSLYACTWEKQKYSAAAAKVTEAREELKVAQARAAEAAVRVQDANEEAAKRSKGVEDAIEASPEWGAEPVPDAVRDELCATLDCGEAS